MAKTPSPMALALVLLMAAAVYRVTVLLLKDYVAEPVRRVMRASGSAHLEYLCSCPWCCSIWAGAVIVPLTVLVSWWWCVDAVLACSAVAGIALDGVKP